MKDFYLIGNEYYYREKYHNAIENYSKAIAHNPTYRSAFYQRGLAKIAIGNKQGGLDDLEKANSLGHLRAAEAIKRFS